MSNYFYIRINDWTTSLGIFKLGITIDLSNRHQQYLTYEPNSGKFIHVYEIYDEKMKLIENLCKKILNQLGYHYYTDGGTEYYKNEGLVYITKILELSNIPYKKLNDKEIENLCQCKEFVIEKEPEDMSKLSEDIITSLLFNKVKPKPHQQEILTFIRDFYSKNRIGKIIWSCGLGKTLMSLFICMEMNYKSIVIGVPNINLQHQIKYEILRLFPEASILFVGGKDDENIKSTTDISDIKKFIGELGYKFIITTYNSCHLLVNNELEFDFKIGDEAHHLTGIEKSEKSFLLFHKINTKNTLFMTATEKLIEIDKSTILYTMDDIEIFGEYIDKKSLNWAIENKYVTDYSLLVLRNTEMEVFNIIKNLGIQIDNPNLFISAFMVLKSMTLYSKLTHVLIYTNTTFNADIVKEYIDLLLDRNVFPKIGFYNNSLHSNKKVNYKSEVEKFTKSERGIISCVDVFGEGFDPEKLSGVCFAENMESNIRIFQCSQRSGRLEQGKDMSYIILPYIDNNNWNSNKSFKKCRNILSTYRLADETVELKLKMLTLVEKDKQESDLQPPELVFIDLVEDNEELTNLKLRLKYSKTLASNSTPEHDEYEYVKMINKKLKLNSKNSYFESKNIHFNFIDYPDEYFKLKKVWVSWIDFLGLHKSAFIKTKEELTVFCCKIGISCKEEYYEACKIYKELPPDPNEFYNGFSNINFEFKRFKRR